MKIKLQYPVTDADGEVYSELELKRPTVKDLKALDDAKGDIGKMAVLVERLAGVTPHVVNNIDAEDFTEIGEVLGSFFEKSPQIGEK